MILSSIDPEEDEEDEIDDEREDCVDDTVQDSDFPEYEASPGDSNGHYPYF